MQTARVFVWSLIAFLAFGAVAFAAVVAWVVAALRRARADRVGLQFDPVRGAPTALAQGRPVRLCEDARPDPKPFFTSRCLGKSQPERVQNHD